MQIPFTVPVRHTTTARRILLGLLLATLVWGIAGVMPQTAAAAAHRVEGESLAVSSKVARTYTSSTASAGKVLRIFRNGTAARTVTLPDTDQLTIRVKARHCEGPPRMKVRVDGDVVRNVLVKSLYWTSFRIPGSWSAGDHHVEVSFTNDLWTPSCDRDLDVDVLWFRQADSPFDGRELYVDPYSNARAEAAAARREGDEESAELFDRIGDHAQADWFGDWNSTDTVRETVRQRVDTITQAGAYPVLVTYAVPGRDCGGWSAGGVGSGSAYGDWIREVAAGIGGRPAAVILEPDALALLDCLTTEQRDARLQMLRDAVAVLRASGPVAVYLDGGHSAWHPAAVMADRLRAAGVGKAQGFVLNVSNFRATGDELAYGRDVALRVGGKHFVVDTSRNGTGPAEDDAWCNPPGRGLGHAPGTAAGEPLADAFLWIKRPGESDGDCGRGEPAAGTWWPEYARDLADRAALNG